MEWFNYLLKVSACSALFFAFFLLVLKRLTFFKINRFYLLFTLVLSFVIPALQFTVEREVEVAPMIETPIITQNESVMEQIPFTPITTTTPSIPMEEPFDWFLLLPYLYAAVVLSLLGLAAWRLFKLIKHAKQNTQEINGLKLVPKNVGFTNCSFFNYVFIDENNLTENELRVLLRHEEVHVKNYHSVDKILLIIAKAVLWFNPIVYLYDKALEQIHEYEADEATSQNFGTATYANLLLRLAITKSDMPLVHNFVKSPIKERIKMLYHSKSKQMKKLMYLLALPIGLGLLWGFTVKVVDVMPKTEKEFTLILDAGHGGKQIGAQVNGVKEKDIALAFTNKIKTLAEAKGIKVITTRTGDETVSLKDRLIPQGDFLISIHVNSEPIKTGGLRNGLEMYTPTSDSKINRFKAISMTYNLYQNLNAVKGIKTSNRPVQKNLFLLQNSNAAGLILEMGYMTNKEDLKTITNEAKQVELAEAIVGAVERYKKYMQTDEEIALKINGEKLPDPPKNSQQDIPFINRKTVNSNTDKKNENIKITVKNKTVANITFSEIGVAKLFFLINEKIYTEAEAMKFTPAFIAQLSDKNGVGNLKTAYEIPGLESSPSNIVIWFGKEPKLADYALKNKAIYQKYNGKTVEGKVIGFTYSTAKVMNGFLIKIGAGETLKGYVEYKFTKQIADMVKLNDFVSIKIYNSSYWKDSEYPVLTSFKISKNGKLLYDRWPKVEFKRSIIVDKVGMTSTSAYPELVIAKSLTHDNVNDISYVKNGRMEILDGILLAEELILNQKIRLVTAKKGSFTTKNGDVIKGESFTLDLIKGTIEIDNASGKIDGQFINSSKIQYLKMPADTKTSIKSKLSLDLKACTYQINHFSPASGKLVSSIDLISKFNHKASDSVVRSENKTILYGSATVNFDGVVLSGDKIEFDKKSTLFTAYNAALSGVDKNPIKAKKISYNPVNKKVNATDVLLVSGYWDRVIN